MQWTKSVEEYHREAALEILNQILAHINTDFEFFFDSLEGILKDALQDQSLKVRIAALSGTIHFIIYRSTSRTIFQPFVPHMFEVILGFLFLFFFSFWENVYFLVRVIFSYSYNILFLKDNFEEFTIWRRRYSQDRP